MIKRKYPNVAEKDSTNMWDQLVHEFFKGRDSNN